MNFMKKIKDNEDKIEKTSDNKNNSIYFIIIIIFVIVGALLLIVLNKPSKKRPKQDNALTFQLNSKATTLPTEIGQDIIVNEQDGEEVLEMKIEDIKIGTGDEAVSGKTITVNYVGTLEDGTKFDSSYDRNEPFTFNLGAGQVIQGWEKGFEGMKVGGKRKLIIPSDLAYGNRSMGSIPPNSTLIFEAELLKVE